MEIDYTQIILALIAGIPAMLAALATLLVTLRGNRSLQQAVVVENAKCATDVKEIVKTEANKTASVAQEVKATLIDINHQRELKSQENTQKLDRLVETTNAVKTLVNGNLTNILQTSTDALVKAVELSKQSTQPQLLPQEVKITSDSEIKIAQ